MKMKYVDAATTAEKISDKFNIPMAELVDVFAEIPAADVQPVKHGRWESSQRTIETGTVYCSNCAIEYYISDLQTVGDCNGIVNYCPNCGARMDGDIE
jgi:hypothetical protein